MDSMKHIGKHLNLKPKTEKDRRTERGELMQFFCDNLNSARTADGLRPIPMARMGRILQGIPTKDLYYLQSVCNDAKNFSKKFWWELKNETNNDK
jgi:hypothetical protein